MVLTKLALTWALLMTAQAPGDVVFTNLRSGRIPAGINPERMAEIRELQLYVSPDHGHTWNQVDKITPDKGGFTYSVPTDGDYWYHVVVINQQGNQEPADLYKTPPMMKLVVDTKRPELQITSAQRQGDDLVVSWQVIEENPDPSKLTLEFRAADSTLWTPIPLTPSEKGTAKVRLTTSGPLVVKLQFKDLANNAAWVEAQVPGGVAVTGYNSPVVNPPPPDRPTPEVAPPPAVAMSGNPQYPPIPQPPGAPVPPTQPTQPAAEVQKLVSPMMAPQVPTPGPRPAAIASSSTDASQGSQAPAAVSQANPRAMPPIQYVNDPEIVVEYEISKIGPSGLGSVDVWLTKDLGASWIRYAEDVDPGQGTHDKYYQRSLKLPGEGTYGITLIVKSKAGLSKAPPRAGQAPEMLIEVDTQPPTAELMALVPDNQRRDTVILSWIAKDHKLDEKAITLEWAELPTGPWQTIVAGLPPTTTAYAWQPPPGLPAQVYLKLMVRDAAGNVALAITGRPQAVDLNEPEGRVVRVMPANKR